MSGVKIVICRSLELSGIVPMHRKHIKPLSTRSMFTGWDEDASLTADILHEIERDRFTGLLDAKGEPIYRPKIPFGFVGKER